MPNSNESPPADALPRAAMQARFCACFERTTCFREDAVLAEALAREAGPVLAALHTALSGDPGPRPALHESYALLTLLAREAALRDATPSAALALSGALVEALEEAGVRVDAERARALAMVAVEGYCAARDERSSASLRSAAASAQVAVRLAPGCLAVFLAGVHEASDLSPVLDRLARGLLHDDVTSCLLELSRLARLALDEELARAVARFCALAATLGVRCVVVGAPADLRRRFAAWLPGHGLLEYAEDYAAGQARALAHAGFVVKKARRFARLWESPGSRVGR